MTTPTTTTGAADLPEALRSIQRFEVVDCIDDKHVPAVIPKPHGPWVRYEDHIAALAAGQATVAQQGMAYAALPESLILAVDRWFSANTGLGGCSDKDVRELAELFYAVTHAGGRESVDDALAIVESFGPGISGINDTYARQILLAEEVKRLRASRGQAPAGAMDAYGAACYLATTLFEKHFRREPDYASGRVVWGPCDTTAGVISQIDNMVSGLVRPDAGVLEDAARLERERICAAIKAEDDYCVEHGDYMLDSDDCIKIVRGEWVRPDYSVDTARKQGANHD